MMKILVAGASGYLGGKLCCALLKQGHSIRALVNRTSDLSALPSAGPGGSFELAYGDVTDYRSLVDAFFDCQVVFHIAAIVEAWLHDPSRFFSVNAGGLKNVVQAATETLTIEKAIYTSSMVAFGSTDGYVADENQVHHEKFFYTEYEKSKVAADEIMFQAAAEGLQIVAFYPSVINGPGKLTTGNIVASLLIERFSGRLPAYIGNGSGRLLFCYVDDVVEGHIAAMDKGRSAERYLLTGENSSFNHILDIAAIITGTKRPRFSIPLWVMEAFEWLCILISRLTGKLPFIAPLSVHVLRHQWSFSCEKAKAELGYNPRSLKEGLEEMLPWLKSLGLIEY